MAFSLALMLLVGILASQLFEKIRLPSLLGLILAGVLIGPAFLGWIDPSLLAIAGDLRKLALIIILLRAGLTISRDSLGQAGRTAVLMSIIPGTCEIIGAMLLAPPLLGLSLIDSAVLGSVLGAVSPAVVVPGMLDLIKRQRGTAKGIPNLLVAASAIDGVYLIVIFTVLLSLAINGQQVSLAASILQVPLAITLGIAAGLLCGLALFWLFKHYHLRDTLKVLIILAVAILLTALEAALKGRAAISGLIGVLMIGVVLLDRYAVLVRRLADKFDKLWVFAQIMLFLLVGAALQVDAVKKVGLASVAVILGALVFRAAGVLLSLVGSNLNPREKLFCVVATMPKATVQAAIGTVPLAAGLPVGATILATAILAILITAPLGAIGIRLLSDRCLSDDSRQAAYHPALAGSHLEDLD